MKEELLKQIEQVERIAAYSKLKRLLHNPKRYIYAILYRLLVYPISKKEKITEANLFFGKKMMLALPASADIYLTGGKSHPSETRLARFMISNLQKGNHFLDIGAHYGYFTLLAAEIAGSKGKIVAFEPASRAFSLLSANTTSATNITIYNKAVSNKKEPVRFYEFNNLYSEYNTGDISQFVQEKWFANTKHELKTVEATTIDTITKDENFIPDIIKIDVEGGEYDVIQGGIHLLKKHSPKLVMEYLAPARNNLPHQKAAHLLNSLGYNAYAITYNGELQEVKDIDAHLYQQQADSDNIVFMKTQ